MTLLMGYEIGQGTELGIAWETLLSVMPLFMASIV